MPPFEVVSHQAVRDLGQVVPETLHDRLQRCWFVGNGQRWCQQQRQGRG
jgi:hypothetical protein